MPPRAYKVYYFFLRTHKLAIQVTATATTTINELKEHALDALSSDVAPPLDIPSVTSIKEFELCRAIRDKGRVNTSTGAYETLKGQSQVKECNLLPWESLFLQFRHPDTGSLLPVVCSLPPVDDDEEDIQSVTSDFPMADATSTIPSVNKGKRKARPDEE